MMVVFITEVNGVARERFVWSYEQVASKVNMLPLHF